MSESLVRTAVGGDENLTTEMADAIAKATATLQETTDALVAAKASGGDIDAILTEQQRVAGILTDLQAKADTERREAAIDDAIAFAKDAKSYADNYRAPSKARFLGTRSAYASNAEYVKGSFLGAIMDLNSRDSLDAERVAAKATLIELGSRFMTPEEAGSKATLGTTDATGGWIIPNAVVEPVLKVGQYQSGVTRLVDRRTGFADQYQVDLPFRRAAPARAVVAPWGDTKENVNLVYEGYTATMYTLARIYDISKQFARKSRGAAEQDVIGELRHGFDLGEAYYILQGSGTAEPYGLQTALALGGAAAYVSAFTASATTLAGSIATAIATASGALAGRNQTPEAALMSATSYWLMLSQGTDTAGFFFAPSDGPTGITPGTLVSPFGVPVIPENQLTGSDDLIVGAWSKLKVYYGDGFRVDSSDVAGERWDKNLIGFRGEMEMGLDARPAVFTGAFQAIADIVP